MNNLRPLRLAKQTRLSGKIKKYGVVLIIALAGFFLVAGWLSLSGTSTAFNFVFGQASTIKTHSGKVNVLLLGIAGGRHDGATLTDTLMVASYDLKTHQVYLLSIPRDLWLDEHQAKVNTLYQAGLLKGDGLQFAREEVGKILGIKIPYAVRVDFNGFVQAVNLVGGVNIHVSKPFDDYKYPVEGKENDLCGYQEQEIEIAETEGKKLNIPPGNHRLFVDPKGEIATETAKVDFNCRYEHISFKEGLLQMDGAQALKFVRSRSGTNREGSDFARSKRQQLALQAFREKALSLETLTDPKKLGGLVQTFGKSVSMDVPQSQYLEFSKIIRNIEGIRSFSIDTDGEKMLLATPKLEDYGGAWALVPPKNDFEEIRQYVDNILSGNVATESGKVKK